MKLKLIIISALCCFLGTGVQGFRSRINNGQIAQVADFKYLVGIKIKHFLDPSYCTGSIIAEKFILTAAHCFAKKDKKNKDGTYSQTFVKTEVVVYANVIGLDKEYRKKSHAIKGKGVSVYFVPDYFKNSIADIAVLELDSALSFHGGLVEKLERPGPSKYADPPGSVSLYNDVKGVLAGYGEDKLGKDNNNKLKWIDMTVVPHTRCQAWDDRTLISEARIICAKAPQDKFSGCEGDSGAPLVVTSKDAKKTKTVIGVLSRGDSCKRKSTNPNVFVRVSHYEDFIFNAIRKSDNSPKLKKYELKKS